MALWQRVECLPKRPLVSASFSTMAKITAQDFELWKSKQQFWHYFLQQNKLFFNKISNYSPTKLQVVSQKKKKLSEMYFWCSATVLVNCSLSWVENKSFLLLFFFGGPKQNRGTMNSQTFTSIPKQDSSFSGILWALTQACSWVYQKTPSFVPGSKKTEDAMQILGSLTFLPSPWPSSLKKYPSCICKTALRINEVSGLTDRVPIT